ncbi:MAG: hypothetical protein QM756_10560 [Polyangiaceae bacterium]
MTVPCGTSHAVASAAARELAALPGIEQMRGPGCHGWPLKAVLDAARPVGTALAMSAGG